MRKRLAAIAIALVALAALAFLFLVNPEESIIAPKCPYKMLTGLNCPGCGGQRAVHAFLHGEFRQGFLYNPILLPALAYLAAIACSWLLSKRGTDPDSRAGRFYCAITGRTACLIAFIAIVIYWIARDLLGF